ncbi:MAG: hypothetical protein PUP91_04860 [Rhizonema sp. PD37]|nr:hypothetical protein [Rhizonema sp. PD37]
MKINYAFVEIFGRGEESPDARSPLASPLGRRLANAALTGDARASKIAALTSLPLR